MEENDRSAFWYVRVGQALDVGCMGVVLYLVLYIWCQSSRGLAGNEVEVINRSHFGTVQYSTVLYRYCTVQYSSTRTWYEHTYRTVHVPGTRYRYVFPRKGYVYGTRTWYRYQVRYIPIPVLYRTVLVPGTIPVLTSHQSFDTSSNY
jgi:hypothetical protein